LEKISFNLECNFEQTVDYTSYNSNGRYFALKGKFPAAIGEMDRAKTLNTNKSLAGDGCCPLPFSSTPSITLWFN